ncbi:MAG: ATP-binding cassette domain-containing protein [Chitinophagaceae bacterium]|nr:ATP-binding cassette domain-containing protein [Chitinophagaceae bacterium]
MANYCVQTKNLTYSFSGKEAILKNINLEVEEGCIYGFLGPNGAGKTTTLRLLLGLLKKQHGSIAVFGQSFEKNRLEILKRTGSLIESPSLYGHLTADENLLLLQKIYQCPKERIRKVLELVGLTQTGKKKVSQFSLGMKQRLSIAVAILNSPSLLVLDEPTNGLDPNGIIEMRELLKHINRHQGVTILVSSHLLTEIEKLVTHVGVIHKGSLLFQGTLAELQSKQLQQSVLAFETGNDVMALRIIRDNELSATIDNGRIVMEMMEKEKVAFVNEQLVNNGVSVYSISITKNDLETIFINLTNN